MCNLSRFSVTLHRPRLAVHLDMRRHEARREIGHRRRLRGRRHRVPAAPDAVDHPGRLQPRILGIDVLVPAHRRPLRQPARRARLGDEELAPGGVDPYPEPRQLAVPEHGGSAFDAQAVDGSLAQFDGAHGGQSFPCPGTRAAQPGDPSVTVPRRPGGLPEFRQAGEFSVRKSVFKSQPTDVKSVLPPAPACPFLGLVPDPPGKHNINDYNVLSSY